MTDSRERDVTQAFVSLASHLANGYDVVDLLNDLTVDCARLLDIASAGLLLADGRGVLHVMAASSDRTRQLEVFQLQRAEGPCRDCFHERAAISVPDLAAESARWPQFVPAALDAGFVSVHALPMRLRDNVLGALGLFGTTVGALGQDDLSLGQALADVASVALIQDNAAADRTAVNEQLQTALTSRVVLEQAKGVLAQKGDLDMPQAFAVLRQYARDHNLRLTKVAEAIVSRALPAEAVLDRARARGQGRS
jgi:hypothetical protein